MGVSTGGRGGRGEGESGQAIGPGGPENRGEFNISAFLGSCGLETSWVGEFSRHAVTTWLTSSPRPVSHRLTPVAVSPTRWGTGGDDP